MCKNKTSANDDIKANACFAGWSEEKLFSFSSNHAGNRYCTWYAMGIWKSNQLELKLADDARNEPAKRRLLLPLQSLMNVINLT